MSIENGKREYALIEVDRIRSIQCFFNFYFSPPIFFSSVLAGIHRRPSVSSRGFLVMFSI